MTIKTKLQRGSGMTNLYHGNRQIAAEITTEDIKIHSVGILW